MIGDYDEKAAYRGLPALEDVPEVPAEADFTVHAFEWQWSPHPYILTSDHVNFAAKHFQGEMTWETIRAAEKEVGAQCNICKQQGGLLCFDNHRRVIGMVIMPKVLKEPNDLIGLVDWLKQNEYVISTELKVEVLVFAKPERVKHEARNKKR